MNDQPLVRVEGLHRRYGSVHAVCGVSFQLARGQVMGFLGVNGAGKSTTMAMIAGVLAPDAGEISICGHNLARSPLAAKRALGYLPHAPPLYDQLTVDEYLQFCAALRGVAKSQRTHAVDEVITRCGLSEVTRRVLGNLSQGFRQRVGIAQALVHGPQVLILDEPTSGLDPVQLRSVRHLIRELGEHHAVLLSSHVLSEIQTLCDRVQIMHQGVLVHAADLHAESAEPRQFRVLVGAAVNTDALHQVPGVQAMEVNDRELVLRLSAQVQPDAVLAKLLAIGWRVSEFAAIKPSLEELFVHVASGPQRHSEVDDTT